MDAVPLTLQLKVESHDGSLPDDSHGNVPTADDGYQGDRPAHRITDI